MTGVEAYPAGSMFIVRIWKHDVSEPDLEWTNAYELLSTSDGTSANLISFANIAQQFEQAIHSTAIEFSRATVSTWIPDSHPYDPYAFLEVLYPSGTLGTRSITGDKLPLRVAWGCKRATDFGRSGKLYYRGCLGEADVQKGIQSYSFSDPAARGLEISTQLAATGLGAYTGAGDDGLRLALIGLAKGATEVTKMPVVAIVSHTPVDVQMNHRWFNHAAVPG